MFGRNTNFVTRKCRKMSNNLVIVESPAKAKTIKKYLGKNYEVIASQGHVRDLPKSKMGVDIENDYEPQYITIRGKGDLVASLKKAAKKADMVYLATDPDREGEAISYHLAIALKLEEGKFKRITFNEITKKAVKESIKNARPIDMNLVNAQQARRVLDRLVGYEISPLLWDKVKRGLSAGRVQSATLKMIVDREEEISRFVPREYWTLDIDLTDESGKKKGTFHYSEELPDELSTDKVINGTNTDGLKVSDVKETGRTRKAPLPFTTSTMQQTASRKLNFTTSKVMRIAQALYESGYITYLRTDSTRISDEADAAAKAYIKEKYGEEFVAGKEAAASNGKKIQDAHEAIRPTDVEETPEKLKAKLSRDEFRLYQLIYTRFLASRMKGAKFLNVQVTVSDGKENFKATTSKIVFKGYLSVYNADDNENEEKNALAEKLAKGDKLKFVSFDKKQHFTAPPAHFTEALLVKTMEENGIGRPSTYAPTISTLQGRRYVIKEDKNLYITDLGEAVNGIMEKAFPEIIDVEFTANMEMLLDSIGDGDIEWKTVIRNFYPDLEKQVQKAGKVLENVKIADEVSDTECEECGRMMVIKYGPHGKFLACPGFPECRNTKPYFEKIGVDCPKCGQDIVVKKTKKGRRFYGCISQECDYMSWQKPKNE